MDDIKLDIPYPYLSEAESVVDTPKASDNLYKFQFEGFIDFMNAVVEETGKKRPVAVMKRFWSTGVAGGAHEAEFEYLPGDGRVYGNIYVDEKLAIKNKFQVLVIDPIEYKRHLDITFNVKPTDTPASVGKQLNSLLTKEFEKHYK